MDTDLFHLGSTKLTTLRELFIHQLQHLYDAESQLIVAFPKMILAASDYSLRASFTYHLQQTVVHLSRLKDILTSLDAKLYGKACYAVAGLIQEGVEMLHADSVTVIKDISLISVAQHIAHYEIASYGAVRSYAAILGLTDIATILQTSLDEEGVANKRLSAVASHINKRLFYSVDN